MTTPFTLSSSAQRPSRPAFTVKALGDFSASLADLRIGSKVLVEGPHGEGVHDQSDGPGRLLIAAGVGITPAVSVLRTAAQGDDPRRLLLVYGSRGWTDVTFREELADLERTLPNLKTSTCSLVPRQHGTDNADGSARAFCATWHEGFE
jgi:predicted ferric reductase